MIRSFKITSKLYDLYKSKKEIDKSKFYLFRSGMFYNAKYVSKKTLLKLSNLSNDVVKCGFPYNQLDKYMELFNNLGIEVEIVNNNIDNNGKIGIPIGNYTSQYFANIYLDKLDKYIKYELGIK